MRRREFITLLGGAAAWPLAAQAQQPTKMKRIAIVRPSGNISDLVASNKFYGPFFEELGRLGYVEGQNLVVERYSAEGRTDHFGELARDVVSTHPDVVYLTSAHLASAFKMNTATIPIVTISMDPVAYGTVSSIARPGGNITGVAIDAGIEIYGKQLGLLLEAIPKPSNARFLASRDLWEGASGRSIRAVAKQADISMAGALLEGTIDEAQIRRLFAFMEQDRVDALVVSAQAEIRTHCQLLVDLAATSRIPAIYTFRECVVMGGLMAYASDLPDAFRRAANIIDQILKGANPGDIPFYQPTKFELVINVKTAKALGLDMPATLIGRADEVIE